ncbi:MAG: acyl-CoA synthetase [Bradymonadia bacterium]
MQLHSFWLAAAAAPERAALIDTDETRISRAELLARCNQLVHGLRALGLKKGDTVAVVLPNGRTILEVALACAQAGLYLTPINVHLTVPEMQFILRDCLARAVVCDAAHADLCHGALTETDLPANARFVVGGAHPHFRPYSELTAGQPTEAPDHRLGGFVMTYTSGTTGRPRGVRRPTFDVPADALAESFTGFLRLFGITEDLTHLVTSPLYHTAVINFCLYSLHFGHTVVLMEKWSAEGFLDLVRRHRVNTTHMVPTHFGRLLSLSPEVRAASDTTSLTHVIHSAAPCPVDVKRRMLDWLGPVVWEYYAASEGGGTTASPADWQSHPGTVGRPWAISEIQIRDDAGEVVPTGTPGTVWIRMGEYKFEYHGDDDKTRKAWSDKFFTVGDAGYMDADGFLYLCDRKADMIISGGVNIYPAEIEAALLQHPAVADCAVFGLPDDDMGERVMAVIEAAPGHTPGPAVAESILAYARTCLASFKCPRTLDFAEVLPRDPNGKLYKRRLREQYLGR